MGLAAIPNGWGVFAAAYGGGVEVSRDGGATWSASNEGITDLVATSIALVPDATGSGFTLYYGGESAAFASVDGGATWSPLPGLPSVVAWAHDADAVYAATLFDGVRRRRGTGVWTAIDQGLDTASNPQALVVDPKAPGTLWLASIGGMFRSVDSGDHWLPVAGALPDWVRALLVDPASGDVFAGTSSQGLYRSRNDGASWQAVNDIALGNQIYALAAGPHGVLYAAGNGGVAVSTDGGTSWKRVAAPEGPSLVQSFAVDALHPERLYAGTFGQGVLELDGSAAASFLATPDLPDFRFSVRVTDGPGAVQATRQEADCIGETVCVSGALAGRSELFLRVVGPKPNGYLWPTLVKFSTSRIEVWVEQKSKSITRYYLLQPASRDSTDLAGFYDREGFHP